MGHLDSNFEYSLGQNISCENKDGKGRGRLLLTLTLAHITKKNNVSGGLEMAALSALLPPVAPIGRGSHSPPGSMLIFPEELQ